MISNVTYEEVVAHLKAGGEARYLGKPDRVRRLTAAGVFHQEHGTTYSWDELGGLCAAPGFYTLVPLPVEQPAALHTEAVPDPLPLSTKAPAEAPKNLLNGGAQYRKDRPVARGFVDYFPDAMAGVAHISKVANEQHNPGQPIHLAMHKSTDDADCVLRHLMERGTLDDDGLSHTGKAAWRAMRMYQAELEAADPTLRAHRQAQRDRAARGE